MRVLFALLFSSLCFAESEIGFIGNQFVSEGFGFKSEAQEITADDQVLSVGTTTLFKLSSDSSVANQRTVLLSKPTRNNHLLILNYEDDASDKIQLQDGSSVSGGTGVVKLGGIWTPNAGDTLMLIYSDPDYLELSRSNN